MKPKPLLTRLFFVFFNTLNKTKTIVHQTNFFGFALKLFNLGLNNKAIPSGTYKTFKFYSKDFSEEDK